VGKVIDGLVKTRTKNDSSEGGEMVAYGLIKVVSESYRGESV
jgi:hypothetical protein